MNADLIARQVIQQAGLPNDASLTQVGGGFSGATVWRVECAAGTFALKKFPDSFDSNYLQTIHELIIQARQAGLTALPQVQRFLNTQSVLVHSGAVWDLVSWQPGEALVNAAPTPARLKAAGALLGRLHRTWSTTVRSASTCPALERRLAAFHDWVGLSRQEPNSDLMKFVWSFANRFTRELHQEIARLANRIVHIQACLCDCWHAHFLFRDEELTGVIDHAAVRLDHPVGDLARLLGSLDITQEQRQILLTEYQQHRILTVEDYELLRVLESSGIICGLIYWYNRETSHQANDRIRALITQARKLK